MSSCSSLQTISNSLKEGQKSQREKRTFQISWSKNLDPKQETGNLPLALNSPTIHKGVLFAGSGEGEMSAYELANGRLIWQTKDNGYYHQKPIIFEDHVIYGTVEGRVYSRHYLTGKIRYEVDLDSAIESEGVVSGGRLFFHLRNHKLFSLDVKTGKILWAYRRSVPFLTTVQKVSKPLVVGRKLYVGFADGAVACFSIEDGNLLWEQKLSNSLKFVDVDASPIMIDGKLIVGSMAGKVSILNPDNGGVIKNLPFSISRSPKLIGEEIYFVNMEGELSIYSKELVKKESVKLSDKSLGDFKFDGNRIVVGTLDGRFIELNRVNLASKRTLELGHDQSAIFGDIEISENHMAFISSRYRLYVIKK